nr:MAG TPA: hypothetical protein [Bacteriophage sp.]
MLCFLIRLLLTNFLVLNLLFSLPTINRFPYRANEY